MNIEIVTQLFVLGVAVSSSFCLIACTPVFYFTLSLKEQDSKNFVYSIIKLNIARFFTMLMLSLVLYLLFGKLFASFVSGYYNVLMIFFGVIFIFIGFSIISPKTIFLIKVFEKFFNPQFLGVASGMNLCLPKILAIGYIFVNSADIKDVLIYTSAFALGEAFSPTLILFFGVNYLKNFIVGRLPTIEKYFVFIFLITFVAVGLAAVCLGIMRLE